MPAVSTSAAGATDHGGIEGAHGAGAAALVRRRTITAVAFANLAGVAFLLGSAALALPDPKRGYSKGEVLAVDIAVGAALIVVSSAVTLYGITREFRRMHVLLDT